MKVLKCSLTPLLKVFVLNEKIDLLKDKFWEWGGGGGGGGGAQWNTYVRMLL